MRLRTAHAAIIGEQLQQVLKVLEGSEWNVSAKAVTATPEALPLRLQPRDVIAFRRLASREECDQDLERFLLECAAVRVRITREAEEIVGLIGDEDDDGHRELYHRARRTTRLADAFECRLSHHIRLATDAGRAEEARTLQHLRMRLMRDYAGLYLLLPTGEGLTHRDGNGDAGR